jgi:lysozyme
MAAYDRAALETQLAIDEGVRLKPYRDTKGRLTIGIGRNLDDVGLSRGEAIVLLDADISRAEHLLDANAPWWRGLDAVRQAVLMNMCFNMGWGDGLHGLSGFHNMLGALERGDYAAASRAMQSSGWAAQVAGRALRLARMMESGALPGAGA